MVPHAEAIAAKCARLVMKALVATGGDHAIIRSGRVPVMVRDDHRYRMSGTALPRVAVAEIAQYLLPKDELRALIEIGETRYHLPHTRGHGSDDFIVDVVDRGGEICIDIEHHRIPESDEVPAELFAQAHP